MFVRKEKRGSKRGQVFVFIIAGILIIILLILLVGVKKTFINEEAKEPVQGTTAGAGLETGDINNIINGASGFVETCLQQVTRQGIITITMHGGYFVLPKDSYEFHFEKTPYYYSEGRLSFPDVRLELEKYIKENMPGCINNFDAFRKQSQNQDVKIDAKKPEASVNFKDRSLTVILDYPITIKSKTSTLKLERFIHTKKSNLNEISMVSRQISEAYASRTGGCFECLQEASQNISQELSISIAPLTIEDTDKKPVNVFLVAVADETFSTEEGILVYRFILEK